MVVFCRVSVLGAFRARLYYIYLLTMMAFVSIALLVLKVLNELASGLTSATSTLFLSTHDMSRDDSPCSNQPR